MQLVQYRHPDPQRSLRVGRTLVIHDSFMAVYTKDILRPLFRDISFIYVDAASAELLQNSLSQYDYVVFESAERLAFGQPRAMDNSISRLLQIP